MLRSAISGTGDFQLHMARELGASATLAKPIDAKRLVQAVDDALAAQTREVRVP